ncbi:MAG: rod shape-determining protein MreC [Propionibacteriales bacterium]|nr:rod shape-determining protein MreC [Propionibacteriales bacterium]
MRGEPRRSRAGLGLLVLASVTILTLDVRHTSGASPLDPLRSTVGAVLGPVEDGATAAFTPLTDLPAHFTDVDALRRMNDSLRADNDALTQRLRLTQVDQQRATEVRGLARLADRRHFGVVSAQVVAMGSAQSFSRTVTIDAGTSRGVVPDLTVVNADGLVGRVIEATRSTATVLLIIDAESTVGGRLSDSMELGFLDGDGDVSAAGSLELSLIDHKVAPRVGDSVVSWGSEDEAPYVAGVPIGRVMAVHSSPAELTQTATIQPYVDFSSLDVVAVVTAAGRSDSNLAEGAAR